MVFHRLKLQAPSGRKRRSIAPMRRNKRNGKRGRKSNRSNNKGKYRAL